MIGKVKRNLVIILAVIMAFGAFGFSIYNVTQQPKQIETYFQEHKDELKGDRGEKGDQGKRGGIGENH